LIKMQDPNKVKKKKKKKAKGCGGVAQVLRVPV
jgi:hypothetical protein